MNSLLKIILYALLLRQNEINLSAYMNMNSKYDESSL